MKINLEINEPTIIKYFSFDANNPYEQTLVGKGKKNEIDNRVVINFVGKSVSEAETWGKENNINILKEYVTSDSSKFNGNVNLGLIGSQSVIAGANLDNITSITIYINTVKENNEDNIGNNDDEDNLENIDDINNNTSGNYNDDLEDDNLDITDIIPGLDFSEE